jgi:hypothetical protein
MADPDDSRALMTQSFRTFSLAIVLLGFSAACGERATSPTQRSVQPATTSVPASGQAPIGFLLGYNQLWTLTLSPPDTGQTGTVTPDRTTWTDGLALALNGSDLKLDYFVFNYPTDDSRFNAWVDANGAFSGSLETLSGMFGPRCSAGTITGSVSGQFSASYTHLEADELGTYQCFQGPDAGLVTQSRAHWSADLHRSR